MGDKSPDVTDGDGTPKNEDAAADEPKDLGLNLGDDLTKFTVDELHDRLVRIDTEIDMLGDRSSMSLDKLERRNELIAHEVAVTEMVEKAQADLATERPSRPARITVNEPEPAEASADGEGGASVPPVIDTTATDETDKAKEPIAAAGSAPAVTQTFENPGGIMADGVNQLTTRVEHTPAAEAIDHYDPQRVVEESSALQAQKREDGFAERPGAMFAAVGSGTIRDGNMQRSTENEIGYDQIANSLVAAARGTDGKQKLYTRDRFAGLDVKAYGSDLDANVGIHEHNLKSKAAMSAALCGPTDVDRTIRICGGGTNGRPVTQKIIDENGVDLIGNGQVAWMRGLSLCDVDIPDPFLDCDDVAAIDLNDQSTWKQCSTLPDCDDVVCKASVNFLYRCLITDICDEMSRSDYIEAFESLLEARLDQAGEQAVMRMIDSYSYKVNDANPTGYGSLLQLIFRIQELLGQVENTCRFDTEGYCLTLNAAHVRNVVSDGYFAGATLTDVVNAIRSGLTEIGVDLNITADWGDEGNPITPLPLPQPRPACGDSGAVTQEFDAGVAATSFCARLWRPRDFRFASAGLEDYGVVTGPSMKLTNKVLRFGETVEVGWKPGVCPSFLICFENACPNGARPGPVCPDFCEIPEAPVAP